MAQIKDKNSPEYQKYFDELMNTHDLRMKYTEEFLSKGTKGFFCRRSTGN